MIEQQNETQGSCQAAALLFRQITEAASAYAQAALLILQTANPKSEEFVLAAEQAEEAAQRLRQLRVQLETHKCDHGCPGVLRQSASQTEEASKTEKAVSA